MALVGDDILNVRPLISVGMPVFNEDKFLKQSIESILNQDYVNFELIISDNASTDQTEQICLDFEKQDRRVKYKRNRANWGALENFYKVFQEANGEFFMFAGGHDLWSNNFMSTCLITLQDCPETVLSFASTVWINESNICIEKKSPFYDTRGCDPVTRFMYVLWGPMNPIYGIMRIRDMEKVRINIHTIGLDLIILSELSFLGQFAYNPEATWFRRMQHGEETVRQKNKRYKKALFFKRRGLFTLFLYLKLPFELWRSIAKAKICVKDKICMFILTIVAFPVKFFISMK